MPTWYLKVNPEDIAPHVILLGDPARAELVMGFLEAPKVIGKQREYLVITARYQGAPLTVVTTGMGAPAAAVAVEELAQVGAKNFIRVGTTMTILAPKGHLVLAQGACRLDGTSDSYAPSFVPALADASLYAALRASLQANQARWCEGLVASVDGFYSQMVVAPERAALLPKAPNLDLLRAWGIQSMDMETAGLYLIARFLQVRAVSLCAATVSAPDYQMLPSEERKALELELIQQTLKAIQAIHSGGL